MNSQLIIKEGTISGGNLIQPAYMPVKEDEDLNIKLSKGIKLGFVIGNSGRKFDTGDFLYQTIYIDLDHPDFLYRSISVPFLGHGLAFNPRIPERAALFEKRGKGACEIDFKTGKVLRIIHTSPNRQFYGHGAYSTDGKILYSAETITVDDFSGVIIMRDTDTLDVIGEFPSYGARPHDCQLLKDGRTMIITNGGGLVGEKEKGSVTYVDIHTHKLIKKLIIENKRLNAGHVAHSENEDIAVVSAPREGLDFSKEIGGISLGNNNRNLAGGIASRKILDKLLGETLSVCIDNNNRIAAATSPDANCVTFWDIDTAKLKHIIKVKHPRGITMTQDKRFFILNYDNPEFKIGMINSETLKPVEGFDLDIAITGSHIVNYHF